MSGIARFAALLLLALGFALSAGCATAFFGDAHFGGPRKCFRMCQRQNMNMAGYVFMGHYSSACICEVKGHKAQRNTLIKGATAAAGGSVVGVVMRMRRAAAAAQANR